MVYVIVNRGTIRGPQDRRRRDSAGEKLEGIRKRSIEVKRQTGKESGPMRVRDWEK